MSAAERLPRTRTGRPRLTCTYNVLEYWAERIHLVRPPREDFSYSSMICEGDRLFHYGHHFELARILRDKRGRTRLVLCNGDTWPGGGFGPSTASRQADVRSAVARANVPWMVVPFSALVAAGIDFDSIRPIHVRDERWTTEDRSSRKRPIKRMVRMADPSGAMTTETYWNWNSDPPGTCTRSVPVLVDDPNQTLGFSSGHGWSDGAKRGEDGVWRWTEHRHWLGDSVFRARCTEQRTRKVTGEELSAEERWRAWEAEMRRLRDLEENVGHRLRGAHWRKPIGYRKNLRLAFAKVGFEQRIQAHYQVEPPSSRSRNGRTPITVERWATFLSSFDYQEAAPLYFLCELPHGAKPNTVDEAVEALKPPEVVAALARGLKVIRQGDLFAIPTKLTKRQIRKMQGGDFTKRLRVLGTNHSVTEGIVCKGGAVLGRGVMRHEPDGWRQPDHRSQKLGDGKTWHILVRNTVPRTH